VDHRKKFLRAVEMVRRHGAREMSPSLHSLACPRQTPRSIALLQTAHHIVGRDEQGNPYPRTITYLPSKNCPWTAFRVADPVPLMDDCRAGTLPPCREAMLVNLQVANRQA
jgi:hypothetical protein